MPHPDGPAPAPSAGAGRRALLLALAFAATAPRAVAESPVVGAWSIDQEAWRRAMAATLLESVQGRERGLTARMLQMLEAQLAAMIREQERPLAASFVLRDDGRFDLVDAGGVRLLAGRWQGDPAAPRITGDGPAGSAAWRGTLAGERLELRPEPGPDGAPSPLLGGVSLSLIRRP